MLPPLISTEPLESMPSPPALTVIVPPEIRIFSPVSCMEPPPPGPLLVVVVLVAVFAASTAATVVEPEPLIPSSLEVRLTSPLEMVIKPPSRASLDCSTVTFAPSRTAAPSAWIPSSAVDATIVPEVSRIAPSECKPSSPESIVTSPPSSIRKTPALIPLVELLESFPDEAPPPAMIVVSPPVMMTSVSPWIPSPVEVISMVPPVILT